MSEIQVAVLEQRVDSMHLGMKDINTKLDSVIETLSLLVRVEERQMAINHRLDESRKTLDQHDLRVTAIEMSMPGLRELRGWVIGGVLAGLGMMGAALGKLVMVTQ